MQVIMTEGSLNSGVTQNSHINAKSVNSYVEILLTTVDFNGTSFLGWSQSAKITLAGES